MATIAAATGLVWFAATPSDSPQPLTGRHIVLPGADFPSRVIALAVVPEGAPKGQAIAVDLLPVEAIPVALETSPHVTDPDGSEGRVVAEYAARRIAGIDHRRWLAQANTGVAQKGKEVEIFQCPWSTGGACTEQRELLWTAKAASGRSGPDVDYSYVIVKRPKRHSLIPGQWMPAGITNPPASPTLWDWVGSSSGLAYALAYLDERLNGTLIPDGMEVAATGNVQAVPQQDTRVTSVEGIEQKLIGAARAGATVAFVPAGQAPINPPLPVVPVRTVEEAVSWLCQHGSEAHICAPTPPIPGR